MRAGYQQRLAIRPSSQYSDLKTPSRACVTSTMSWSVLSPALPDLEYSRKKQRLNHKMAKAFDPISCEWCSFWTFAICFICNGGFFTRGILYQRWSCKHKSCLEEVIMVCSIPYPSTSIIFECKWLGRKHLATIGVYLASGIMVPINKLSIWNKFESTLPNLYLNWS